MEEGNLQIGTSNERRECTLIIRRHVRSHKLGINKFRRLENLSLYELGSDIFRQYDH